LNLDKIAAKVENCEYKRSFRWFRYKYRSFSCSNPAYQGAQIYSTDIWGWKNGYNWNEEWRNVERCRTEICATYFQGNQPNYHRGFDPHIEYRSQLVATVRSEPLASPRW